MASTPPLSQGYFPSPSINFQLLLIADSVEVFGDEVVELAGLIADPEAPIGLQPQRIHHTACLPTRHVIGGRYHLEDRYIIHTYINIYTYTHVYVRVDVCVRTRIPQLVGAAPVRQITPIRHHLWDTETAKHA